jgi:hypothetical protein
MYVSTLELLDEEGFSFAVENYSKLYPVLGIRMRMFLEHPDPLVRGTDPISDPSIYHHQANIVLSFLMTKASLAQWRILLAYYEREASVEAPGKKPRMLSFLVTSSDT